MNKSWYTSKTLWLNVIAFIALIVQSQTGMVIDADLQMGILAVINFILRLVTRQQISWKNPPTAPLILLLVVLMAATPGCATKAVTGTGTATQATDATAQWDQTAVKVYKLTGLTIQTAQALLPAAQPFLSTEDYASHNILLNTTVPAAYDVVGKALEAVVGVTDTAKRQDAIATYEAALLKLAPLMVDVTKVISAIQAAEKGEATK